MTGRDLNAHPEQGHGNCDSNKPHRDCQGNNGHGQTKQRQRQRDSNDFDANQ